MTVRPGKNWGGLDKRRAEQMVRYLDSKSFKIGEILQKLTGAYEYRELCSFIDDYGTFVQVSVNPMKVLALPLICMDELARKIIAPRGPTNKTLLLGSGPIFYYAKHPNDPRSYSVMMGIWYHYTWVPKPK